MNRSIVLSVGVIIVLGLWMLSGQFTNEEPALDAASQSAPTTSSKSLMRVKVRDLIAQEIGKEVVLQGRLEPIRQVEIKSQLTGIVDSIPVEKGRLVSEGDLLVKLNIEDRQSRVARVESEIEFLSLEVDAAKKLLGKGLNSENLLRSAEAELARAQSDLASAKLAVSQTFVRAPFSGVWEQRFVEQGSHLDVGHSIGLLVDNRVLKAVGFVSQQAVSQLSLGQIVDVRLLDGRTALGTLTYIANVGDEETQSFRIEAEIDNTQANLHAGTSAELRIETGTQLAHFVTPSVFSLGEKGEVGIKSVDELGKVVFHPIQLVRKDLNGVWVSGLPEQLTLITLGQGFVNVGEQVTAVRS